MPYAVCVNAEPLPGDVGFGKHYNTDAEIALGGGLLQVISIPSPQMFMDADQQTNLRTPLPEELFVKTKPGREDWDEFVVWLYTCSIHPAFRLNNSHWTVGEIHQNRAIEDWTFGEQFLTSAASEYY
jgi:hypothetical protein